jgi:hypothetical protein
MWLCVVLLLSTVGTSIWAVKQTFEVVRLTADLAMTTSSLSTIRARHKIALRKQKTKMKAKARFRQSLVAVPILGGVALAAYFEKKDYEEWLLDNPNGNPKEYACEVAASSAEVVNELVGDTLIATQRLPERIRPNREKIIAWLEIPKCVIDK